MKLEELQNEARNDLAIKGRIVVIDYQMAILKLFPSKKMNPIFAVGVASEDEMLKTTLNIKRKEILAQILPIDKSLHNQLVNIFGF